MTKRDFELIARVVAQCGDDCVFGDYEHRRVAELFADKLAYVSPCFNRARFLAACGVES